MWRREKPDLHMTTCVFLLLTFPGSVPAIVLQIFVVASLYIWIGSNDFSDVVWVNEDCFWFSESDSVAFAQSKLQLILSSYRLCKDAKIIKGGRKGKQPFKWLLMAIWKSLLHFWTIIRKMALINRKTTDTPI